MEHKETSRKSPNPFKVPNDYFESFGDRLFSQLDQDPENKFSGSSGFVVPDNYFERSYGLDVNKFKSRKIEKQESRVVPIRYLYLSGIAASILLCLFFFYDAQSSASFDGLEVSAIENYLIEKDLNAYELASELELDSVMMSAYNTREFLDGDIENYLIENTDIEELIIE